MADSISSLSTDVDKYFNRNYNWDIFLFFEPPSNCKEHPDFVQARPFQKLFMSKNKLKQYFLLKNVQKFPVCYRITVSNPGFYVLPAMGVIDGGTDEIIHVSFKPDEGVRSLNEVLDIHTSRCPCPSLTYNINGIREFWNNVAPEEVFHTLVIAECTRKEEIVKQTDVSEITIISLEEQTYLKIILNFVSDNWKYIGLALVFSILLIINFSV